MRVLILSLAVLAIGIVFTKGLRGTIFELSIKRGRYGGFFIARELFLLILLGCFIIEIFGLNELNATTYYITDQSILETTPIIVICVGLLICAIAFFSKTIFRKQLTVINDGSHVCDIKLYLNSLHLLRVVILFLVLLVLLVHATGVRHAFVEAIIFGEDLLAVRLYNRFGVATPSILLLYIKYITQLSVILLALYGKNLKNVRYIIYFSLILYTASILGEKAPVIQVFVSYYATLLCRKKIAALSIIFMIPVMIVLLSVSTYVIVKIQYPDMSINDFLIYLVDRLGIGQIQGVYEQFALRISDFSYILKELPFTGSFFEVRTFSKDLAMMTFGYYREEHEVGLMNSFFIGEALAIGGELLVFLSPIFVAFSFCFVCYLTIAVLRRGFAISFHDAQIITALFISSVSTFTGDLGGLLFGKAALLYAAMYAMLYVLYRFLPRSLKSYRVSATY